MNRGRRVAVPIATAFLVLASLAAIPGPGAVGAAQRPGATTTLQALVNATPRGGTLDLRGRAFTTPVVISKPLTVIGLVLRVRAGKTAVTIRSPGVTLDHATITGAQSARYVASEIGILATKASGLRLTSTTIRRFGRSGIEINGFSGFEIDDATISDVGYAGIIGISVGHGTVLRPRISSVGVSGTSPGHNSYGITWTEQGGAPPHDITVDGRGVGFIDNVPYWHGFDTHSGHDLVLANIRISRTPRPIFLTSGTRGSTGPANIELSNVRIEAAGRLPSGATNPIAVTLVQANAVAALGLLVIRSFGSPVIYDYVVPGEPRSTWTESGTIRF